MRGVETRLGFLRTLGQETVRQVGRWSPLLALLLLLGASAVAAAPGRAYFFLASDQVRALRNVAPAENLVLGWTKRVEVLGDKDPNPPDEAGTLSLAPDYMALEKAGGGIRIVDFALRRTLSFGGGQPGLRNDSLFAALDFYDMEASNRAVLGRAFKRLGRRELDLPGHEQYLFEAALGVRTPGAAPMAVDVSKRGDRVSVQYMGGEIASVRFGREELTPAQGEMLARALRNLFPIHPAALEAVLPLRRLPVAIETVHSYHVRSKARTSIRLERVGTRAQAYPLPAGLAADVSYDAYSRRPRLAAFLKGVTDTALQAIRGSYAKPRPSFEDYSAAADQARKKGDPVESGLAWLAASLHYPDRMAACEAPGADAFCAAYRAQMRAAGRAPQFGKIAKAAEHCTRQEWEQGVRTLASVDVSGKPHGYVASMIMFCLAAGLPAKTLKTIDGMGTRYPLSALDSGLAAIKANPYVPSYYYDIGVKFARSYMNAAAWRMFDLGYALGGGARGDAFDVALKKREHELLVRHPGFF